jgi:hypothetical protein
MVVTFRTQIPEDELDYMRECYPDRNYLKRIHSRSEAWATYFTHSLGKSRRLQKEFGKAARMLEYVADRIKEDPEHWVGEYQADESVLVRSHQGIGKLQEGDIMDCCERDTEGLIRLHYVKLPWGNVRLQVNDGKKAEALLLHLDGSQ